MLLRMLVLSAACVALASSMFTASPSFSSSVGKDFSRLDFASNAMTGCALLSPPARPSVKTWATSWPSVAPTSSSKELEARSSTLGHVHPQQIRGSGPKGWYDMIWYDMIWYDMIWYDMIWYMIWYDMIWYDMIRFDTIWYDMIWYVKTLKLMKSNEMSRSFRIPSTASTATCNDWNPRKAVSLHHLPTLGTALQCSPQNNTRCDEMALPANPAPEVLRDKAAWPCRRNSFEDFWRCLPQHCAGCLHKRKPSKLTC